MGVTRRFGARPALRYGCILALVYHAASFLDSDGLRTKLQAIADAKAKQYDCTIAIGVQTGTEAIAVASRGSAVTGRFRKQWNPTEAALSQIRWGEEIVIWAA